MGTTTDKDRPSTMKLSNGSRIGVIGGGPAGSFYSYFFLDIAERAGLDVNLDIYKERVMHDRMQTPLRSLSFLYRFNA